jgi:hypothetical protein
MLAVDDVGLRARQGYRLLNKNGDIKLLINAATKSLQESRDAISAAEKQR